jgi:hypothetical protein
MVCGGQSKSVRGHITRPAKDDHILTRHSVVEPQMQKLSTAAHSYSIPVTMHLAESKSDADCLSSLGHTAGSYAQAVGLLSPSAAFAHAVISMRLLTSICCRPLGSTSLTARRQTPNLRRGLAQSPSYSQQGSMSVLALMEVPAITRPTCSRK